MASNLKSSSFVLISDPGCYQYQYLPQTITTMSYVMNSQLPSYVCDSERYDKEYQNGR
jgi:hypothetical protein